MQSSRASDAGAQPSGAAGTGEQGPAQEPEQTTLQAENRELTGELARLEDRYKRALADLENYRKRTAREIDSRVAEAKESLLRDWLEAVDSVERAMRMQAGGPCLDGLRAVLDQMDAVLARQGARRIGAPGQEFDPERHEAVATQTSEGVADGTVLAVERSGFMLGDRVIRPAQVVVVRAPEHAH
ncbi:MAG TPA: nucleotide exchange factor GrpE [Solirubrobacteraceae bacterium]|jgi:molecular chaperone GrpE